MNLAKSTLEALLVAGERALVKGSKRAASRRFDGTHGAYWELSVDEREALHAELELAARTGAVSLEYSQFGGEDRPLEVVRLKDAAKLAQFLKRPSQQELMSSAEAMFAPWLASVPNLRQVLAAWRSLRKVRKHGPEYAAAFTEAARVIAHMASQTEEAPVRVVSRHLFRNSKRIEALAPLIDVLTADAINGAASHWEDVLSSIGLRKAPLPFLMAGIGSVQLEMSGVRDLAYEYLAVSPTQIVRYEGSPAWVLCIENMTTFVLAAKQWPERSGGLVLFTGGMPSPTWRRTLARILDCLPAEVPVYHWGDIDEGGFRIAATIAESIAPRKLEPWLMDSDGGGTDESIDSPTRARMARSARRAGWHSLAAKIASGPVVAVEQEELAVSFPKMLDQSYHERTNRALSRAMPMHDHLFQEQRSHAFRAVVRRAELVFGDASKAHRWLSTHSPILAEVPLSLMASKHGRRLVYEELLRVEFGYFA